MKNLLPVLLLIEVREFFNDHGMQGVDELKRV